MLFQNQGVSRFSTLNTHPDVFIVQSDSTQFHLFISNTHSRVLIGEANRSIAQQEIDQTAYLLKKKTMSL